MRSNLQKSFSVRPRNGISVYDLWAFVLFTNVILLCRESLLRVGRISCHLQRGKLMSPLIAPNSANLVDSFHFLLDPAKAAGGVQ